MTRFIVINLNLRVT